MKFVYQDGESPQCGDILLTKKNNLVIVTEVRPDKGWGVAGELILNLLLNNEWGYAHPSNCKLLRRDYFSAIDGVF